MQKDTDFVEHWVDMATQYNYTGPVKGTLTAIKQSTFSKFVYR